jgi:secondary thiamine-phosphate synthase enzyme
MLAYSIDIKTSKTVEFQDITSRINELIAASGVNDGVCYIFVPHTTAGITVNEHADPSVVADIAEYLEEMVPQHRKYHHLEGNSPAHIKAMLLGDCETLFIENGRLKLGTWQGVFFAEFDGPRWRHVHVKITTDSG